MAVQARFCGRCGAQVAPGSPFCGRCGAPQIALSAVAIPSPYTYPMAPPRPPGGVGRISGAQIAVAAGLLVVLSIVTVAVSAFAVSRIIAPRQTCTLNCGPKLVTPLPESHTYRSAQYRYEVDYSSAWKLRSQDDARVTIGTRLGLLQVSGVRTTDEPGIVVLNTVAALPSSEWQDVKRVADLKGAHLGDQDGVGAIYSANLVGTNAKAAKVRFAVIAATKGGVTVVMFALNPVDTKNFVNGMPEGQAFDYVCQEFRWSSTS